MSAFQMSVLAQKRILRVFFSLALALVKALDLGCFRAFAFGMVGGSPSFLLMGLREWRAGYAP